ncbi:MAG: hypothetical protein KF841_05270 [Phycisphaerae bacterium]|nr:hypothetical protein [Phycisphaerae bacterium]
MTRNNSDWWSRTRTALAVIGITLLIWLAADQNVAIEEEFEMTVRLAADSRDRYAGFAEPPYARVLKVKLNGRRNRLRDFRRLTDAGTVFTAVIDRTMPSSTSPRSFSVVEDVLPGISELRESRLAIRSVEPSTVEAIVDGYTTIRDIRVKPDYGGLKISPEFLRNSVNAQVPNFVAKMLGNSPIAIAVPRQDIRSIARPDGAFEVPGVLSFDILEKLDPSLKIEFQPSNEVMITGRIEALTATESKGPIQINWAVPDELQRDYVIVAEQSGFRVYLDVTGPRERVSQLDPRRIRAFVDVLAGDIDNPGPNKEIVREVRFVLPPDFSDCSVAPDAPVQTIRFRLEPRQRGAARASRSNRAESPFS